MSKVFDPRKAAVLDSRERLDKLRPVELLRSLGVAEGRICVDLGSGTGFFTLPLSALVGKGGIVYAVDNSPEMMEHLRGKNPLASVRPVVADITNTGLENSTADLCLVSFVIHEVDHPEQLLAEARRLLRPAGNIAVLDWQRREGTDGPPLARRISLETVQHLLTEGGFADLELRLNTQDNYLVLGTRGP